MGIQLSNGKKGRMKASGLEFVITDASAPGFTTIRFRYERELHRIEDNALRNDADEIPDWGVPPESPGGFCCFVWNYVLPVG